MKILMEFNLPEDRYEYNVTNNAQKYRNALTNIQEYLRSQIKYNDGLTDEKLSAFNDIYAEFFEILKDEDVRLDD